MHPKIESLTGHRLTPTGVQERGKRSVIFIGILLVLVCSRANTGAGTHVYAWGHTAPGTTAATNLVAVACGDYNAIGVTANGSVVSWGWPIGALPLPADVTNVVEVTAGSDHCLALLEDGTTRFWGDASSAGGTPPPTQNEILTLALGTGAQHLLALRPDGSPVEFGTSTRSLTNIPASATNVIAVAASSFSSLAVRDDGNLVVWGDPLAPPKSATNVMAVAAGWYHALALRTNGTLVAWGNAPGVSSIPAQATNIVAIACGGYHCLALRADGKLFAWGDNSSRQCAIPAGISNVVAIACSGYGSLALTADYGPPLVGRVLVNPGLTGVTTRLAVRAISTTPLTYQWLFNGSTLDGATGANLVLTNVQPEQAGVYSVIVSNAFGAVTNQCPKFTVQPVLITRQPQSQTGLIGGSVLMDVAAFGAPPLKYRWQLNGADLSGNTNTLRLANLQLTNAGTYTVTISNLFGAVLSAPALLVVDPMQVATPPVSQSSFPGGTVSLSVGVRANIPLRYQWRFSGGDLAGATASNLTLTNLQYDQAGLYSVVISNAYDSLTNEAAVNVTRVALWGGDTTGLYDVPWALSNVVQVAGADSHRLVLRSDGTVVDWGSALFGLASPPPDLTNALSIAAGRFHAVALRADGSVVAWGANSQKQTQMPQGISNAIAVAAGDAHSLVLQADGTVLGWGGSSYGQTNVPAGLSNVVAISAGQYHSLALRADGTVIAWGAGTNNTGSTQNMGQSMVPAGLSNVIAIAAGGLHSLALKNDGSVVGWGYNLDGQTTTPPGLSNVVGVAAGYFHSLALKSDGTIAAWGYNYQGQTTVPAGLTNVVGISACGRTSSLALIGDGPPVTSALAVNPWLSAEGFTTWVPTQNGRIYGLEYTPSLLNPAWKLLRLAPGSGKVQSLSDPTPGKVQGFYRVRSW